MVDIIIAYVPNSNLNLLEMCLHRIRKYTDHELISNLVVVSNLDANTEMDEVPTVLAEYDIDMHYYPLPADCTSGSRKHGFLVDEVVKCTSSKYVLTLDSDCMPIADGWLDELLKMQRECPVSGILHPWKPPLLDLPKDTMDFRIRSQLCWDNTHVACQLVSRCFIEDLGLKFMEGDDTGLLIPIRAREKGWEIKGFMPTRCALPNNDCGFDPEYNRESCVVFGDMIYHHGGASRETTGHDVYPASYFSDARREIEEFGPELLLERSYQYAFDREEEVNQKRMDVAFEHMTEWLKNNNSLFD